MSIWNQIIKVTIGGPLVSDTPRIKNQRRIRNTGRKKSPKQQDQQDLEEIKKLLGKK